MRSAIRYSFVLICVGLAACGGDDHADRHLGDGNGASGSPGGLPPQPAREVYLSTRDISTAVDASALEMWVDGKQGDLGAAKLAELAAAVSLVTWPELEAIAFGITTVDASEASDLRAHVILAPAATLESRWYAVVGKSLPSGFEWWNSPASRDEQITRFRTDSRPIIAAVTRYDKGGVRHLLVHLSEVVSSADAQTVSVAGASCERVVGGAKMVDSVELECEIDEEVGDLTLTFTDNAPQHVDKEAWRDVGEGMFDFVPEQLAP